MKKAKLIIRIVFGLFGLIFGLNKFLMFMALPPLTPEAGEFMGAMAKTGYLLPIVGLIEVVGGVLLLINKFVPLALVITVPIYLNAFLFHLFLDPAGIGGAVLAMVLNVSLMFAYKDQYTSVVKMNV